VRAGDGEETMSCGQMNRDLPKSARRAQSPVPTILPAVVEAEARTRSWRRTN
jgi:hypothetical protein